MQELDFHIILPVIMCMLLVTFTTFISPFWALVILLLFPQGMIIVRSHDYHRSKKSFLSYAIVNESFVIIAAIIIFVIK